MTESNCKKRVHPIRLRSDLLDTVQCTVRDYSGKPFHLTLSGVVEEALEAWLKEFNVRVEDHEKQLHHELSKRYGSDEAK